VYVSINLCGYLLLHVFVDMYVYICMYICVLVYVFWLRVRDVFMFVCIHVQICVFIYVSMFVIDTCRYVCKCVLCLYTCVSAHMFLRVCV
jgi:hypothetical protein